MLAAIGWALLGAIIGAILVVFAIALTAAKRHGRIAELERANARLLGELATECERSVRLERELGEAKEERDRWRGAAVS